MQIKNIVVLLFNLLLLTSVMTVVSADELVGQEYDLDLVAGLSSDENGSFAFTDIKNGDYILSGVVFSPAMKGMWLTNEQRISVVNGTDITGLVLEMRLNNDFDHERILQMFNRTTISGKTVDKKNAGRADVQLLLTGPDGSFVQNVTSDINGDFTFMDIPNGNYTLSGVVWSPAMGGMWLNCVQELTVSNGQPITDLRLTMLKNDSFDSEKVLKMLDRTTISGKAVDKKGIGKSDVQFILVDKDRPFDLISKSDVNGEFTFTDVPNGNYTLSGLVWSTAMSGMWLTSVQEICVNDGLPVANVTMEMRKNDSIDHTTILSMLDRAEISGVTRGKKGDAKAGTQLVLMKVIPKATKPVLPDPIPEEPLVTESPSIFVANTSSDGAGVFTFMDIPDGNYTLSGIIWSSAMKGMWLTCVQDITVSGGQSLDNITMEMRKNDSIDHNAILSMLNRTNIQGKTVDKSKVAKPGVQLVLCDSNGAFVLNTTSDINGDFFIPEVRDGNYTLSGIIWSSAMKGMWLTCVQDITVSGGRSLDNITMEMRKNDSIDHNAILSMLYRTNIQGKTVDKNNAPRSGVQLVLCDMDGSFVFNTTSDASGDFIFNDVGVGNYTLSGVQWSSAMKGMWLTSVQEICVHDGLAVENVTMEMRKNDSIDHTAILSMLDRSMVQGVTIDKNKNIKPDVQLVLTKKAKVGPSGPKPDIPAPEPVRKHVNITFISGYGSYERSLTEAVKRINSRTDLNITLSNYITTKLPASVDLSQQDIIYVVMVTQNAAFFEDTVKTAIANGAVVIGSNTHLPESSYKVPEGFVDQKEFKKYLSNYWSGASSDEKNFDNLVLYLAKTYGGRADLVVEPPSSLYSAIYHPAMNTTSTEFFTGSAEEYFNWYASRTDGHAFDENAPTIGITFYKAYYPDRMGPIDKLIEGFEAKGANVIACYGDADNFLDKYLDHSNATKANAVVSFHYRSNYFNVESLGVPVLNAVLNSYMNTSQWLNSSAPLPVTNMLRIYGPEGEGVFDPIMIAALEKVADGNNSVEKYIVHEGQVSWLVDRSIAQAMLGIKAEADKKVAIVYYNHGGGKDNIGASYLEVAPSIVNLVKGMDDAGYDVDVGLIPNKTALVDLMVRQGRNVGSWAPGELDALVASGKTVLLPESTYVSWFNELPEERRKEVIDVWGEAPGKLMVHTDANGDRFIVLPVIRLSDNVILAPQPSRGWMENYDTLYHDTELAPNHQYIAFYLWMQHGFDADVMVNMGRHGTVEWLPGKEFCLMSTDWPGLMVGDIPVIYPYVMDGMGEGMQAKRRGNAVVIDHLIPPVLSAGLYGNYSLLSHKVTAYQTSVTEDATLKKAHLQDIVNLTLELELQDRVNVSLAQDDASVDAFLDELTDTLYELRARSMPYGLHILGEAPKGDELVGMVSSMLGSDLVHNVEKYNSSATASFDLLSKVLIEGMDINAAQMEVLGATSLDITRDLKEAQGYKAKLLEADNEIAQVLAAMDAKYIKANLGGDPVLRPDTLPSGRNFYAFDEQLIPTKQAWEEGKALADKWLAQYHAEHGCYPSKVAYILWAGESTRHEGIMEAQVLYMLGVEPVWNSKSAKVEDVALIPASELNRPRIDVMVQISGLYRDTFPRKVHLLDRAVRLAYAGDGTENYVRDNTDRLQLVLNDTIKNESLALDVAQFRIFGPADGDYGTGMANVVAASDTWNDTSRIAQLYIDKMSSVYGERIWGQSISDYIEMQTGESIQLGDSFVFESNLNDTEVILHSRSSNTYGVLDIDDFFQYMGGLSNAIKHVSGDAPGSYVLNLQQQGDMKVETLKTYLNNELYARYFNPKWISGMQQHGFEGARQMSEFVENLWGFEALDNDLISDGVWNKVYENYYGNAELREWMKANNPYAYQSMTARMTETARKGNWDASDAILKELVAEQVRETARSGATCCHHTCGNILNRAFVDGIAQALVKTGEMSQSELASYRKVMEDATRKNVDVVLPEDVPVTPSSSSSRSGNTGTTLSVVEVSAGNQTAMSDAGAGTDLDKTASLKSPVEDSYVEGYEMTKNTVIKPDNSGPSFSGSDIIATILVLAAVGAMYMGFRRRKN